MGILFSLISENLFCRPDFEGVPFLEDWFSLKSFGAMPPVKLPLKHRSATGEHDPIPSTLFPLSLYSNGTHPLNSPNKLRSSGTFHSNDSLLCLAINGHKNPQFNKRMRINYIYTMEPFDEVSFVYNALLSKCKALKRERGSEYFDIMALVNEVVAGPVNMVDKYYRGNVSYTDKLVFKMDERIRIVERMVEEDVDSLADCSVENIQDSVLLQHFIMEQLDTFQRYALKKQLFSFDNTYPGIVNGWLWLFCWVFTVAQWMFCTYWMFVWGVSNGTEMYSTFFITFGLALAQDVLIVQPAGVIVIFVTSSLLMKDRLHYIRDVLMNVYLRQLKESEDAALNLQSTPAIVSQGQVYTAPIEVFQHFLGSCRVANHRVAYHLPAARLLRGVLDEDVFRCKRVLPGTREEKNYTGIAAAFFIAIPAIFAYMGDRSGDLAFQLILTTVVGFFLMANEVLLEVSLVAFIAFYVMVFGVIVYYNPDGWLCNLISNCIFRMKPDLAAKPNDADISDIEEMPDILSVSDSEGAEDVDPSSHSFDIEDKAAVDVKTVDIEFDL